MVHFQRNVFGQVPSQYMKDVARMLKAIYAQESLAAAQDKAAAVAAQLRLLELPKAAELIETHMHETFTYYRYPACHWVRIRTNNPLERFMKEIRRRTRVVGAFPDGHSALMLVTARLRDYGILLAPSGV